MTGNQHSRSEELNGVAPKARMCVVKRYVSRLLTSVMLLLAAHMGFSMEGAEPPAYFADGTIYYTIGAGKTPAFQRDFRLISKGCKWSVRVDIQDSVLAYVESAFDGGSLYTYQRLVSNSGDSTAIINGAVAAIDNSEAPFENGSCINYIWLGLASACYFQESTNAIVQAPWASAKSEHRVAKCEWELLGTTPSLPKRASFFWAAGLFPPPFDTGWCGGELLVHSTTNIGQFEIPLDFSYLQFRPKPNAKSNEERDPQFEVRVIVSMIASGNIGEIVPPSTDGVTTMVEDRRLSSPDGSPTVTYLSTSPHLPSKPEPAALERQRQFFEVAGSQVRVGNPSVKRYFLLSLLALASIPLIYMLFHYCPVKSPGKLG
jgi:hypothetical protein